MLSTLLIPPPTLSAPPLHLRFVSSHTASSPAIFSATLVCSSIPLPPLSAAQFLPHPSNPLPLYGQRPPLPAVSSAKRGLLPPLATSSRLSAQPGLWVSLKAAVAGIPTPVIIAIAAAVVIYTASRVFASPRPAARERVEARPPPPTPPPIHLGEITEDELRQYDGSDPDKHLLMAVKGQIYDVSQSRLFYGPGGPYALFAGKDASRALAKMSFEEKDLTGYISDLGPFELSALQDWEDKFKSKYVAVGTIKKPDALVADTAFFSHSAAAATDEGNGSLSTSDAFEAKEVVTMSQDDLVLDGISGPDDAVRVDKAGGL